MARPKPRMQLPNRTDTEICDTASITVCADGGANRLHQESSRNGFSDPYVGVFQEKDNHGHCAMSSASRGANRLMVQ
jgi:hypothetical protein